MPKIKALIRVENNDNKEEFEANAILQDHILKYKDNNKDTMILEYETPKISRETKDLIIKYPFSLKKKTIGTIEYKKINQLFKVEIKTKKIKRNNNDIEIVYEIENQTFKYQVEEIK